MKKNNNPPLNPFLLSGYVSPDYFCDRVQETGKLISALLNGRNITLVSPRRMGKTGLLRHAFHRIETEKIGKCFYVDLYQTDSFTSLVHKLASVVIGTLDTREEKVMKTISTVFKSLRPVFSIDPRTGEPSVSVDVQADFAEKSLSEIFAYMENAKMKCFVAFDEFQKVAEYDDSSNVEALLRSYIQHLTHVQFVFSGSQRHVLENMFSSASRPFYQSTQMMSLGCINPDAYYAFAEEKLQKHGQLFSPESFHAAYNQLFGHTWYVQMLLNRLYETGTGMITDVEVENELQQIVSDNEATYQTFLRLVTPMQRKLLKAVAIEGEVSEIQSNAFLSRHHLGAPSTVKSAAKSLVEKELLLEENGSFSVYDRFFAFYLRR